MEKTTLRLVLLRRSSKLFQIMKGCYCFLLAKFSHKSLSFLGKNKNRLSYQRVFYTPDTGSLFPYLTAIIDVKKGIVQGITWDDACLFCGNDKCVEDTYDFNGNLGTQKEYKQPTKGCYVDQTKCEDALKNKKPLCDITVYVVWTGDDANGKAFHSSAFRFSAFPAQELQNRLQLNLPHFSVPGSQQNSTG